MSLTYVRVAALLPPPSLSSTSPPLYHPQQITKESFCRMSKLGKKTSRLSISNLLLSKLCVLFYHQDHQQHLPPVRVPPSPLCPIAQLENRRDLGPVSSFLVSADSFPAFSFWFRPFAYRTTVVKKNSSQPISPRVQSANSTNTARLHGSAACPQFFEPFCTMSTCFPLFPNYLASFLTLNLDGTAEMSTQITGDFQLCDPQFDYYRIQ